MELTLETLVQYVPFVGPARAAKLSRLGIFTVYDLLYHFPHRYNDYSLVTPISKAQPGETVTIRATIAQLTTFRTKNGKQLVQAVIFDTSGKITCTWFNQMYLLRVLHEGDDVSFSGTVQWFGNKIVLSNPTYEILSSSHEGDTLHTGRLVAVYPETEGVTSKWFRNRIFSLLKQLQPLFIDELPDSIKKTYHLLSLSEALQAIHFPESIEQSDKARYRLSFDELFYFQTRSKLQKREWERLNRAHTLSISDKQLHTFLDSIPFSLTEDQQKAVEQIRKDMERNIPMNRLLIGDVGSGKTIVAAFAMMASYLCGKTSILMAPTQILAEQHYMTIQSLLKPLGISIDLMTGSTKTIQSDTASIPNLYTDVQAKIVVGTHALLTQKSLFADPGVVVIDEQHRFGVKQRGEFTLQNGHNTTPHLLTMTATPIPRTLAKTLFGNIDVSFLLHSPKGRQQIKTWLVPNEKRQKGYEWIRKNIAETQNQVFIVCPLIETSETMTSVKAVTQEYESLKKLFPEYSIGLLHGRMKAKEKTTVLNNFRTNVHQILLATPVVEVGIDIPNATIIVIEAAERFGLSQLHQLRGRVGRGTKQSYCLLYTEIEDETTLVRLKAMEKIHNGPELAELDLHLRGAGDIFGTKQHGIPVLKIASLTDNELLSNTSKASETILASDPDLKTFPILRERLKKGTIDTNTD